MHPFERFFAERYAAAYAEERRAEDARRAEAFLEVAPPVAGLCLRALTARDLFLLDGYESPFVRGDPAAATQAHIVAVLWMLRVDKVEGGWRGAIGYWLHKCYLSNRWRSPACALRDHAELNIWFANVFADMTSGTSPGGGTRPTSHFLATLLVPLSVEMGAIDPASGRPLIESPVARLFQYMAVLRSRQAEGDHVEFRASDRLRGEALAAWNALTPAEQAPWVLS